MSRDDEEEDERAEASLEYWVSLESRLDSSVRACRRRAADRPQDQLPTTMMEGTSERETDSPRKSWTSCSFFGTLAWRERERWSRGRQQWGVS